jgi:hypothetical protein
VSRPVRRAARDEDVEVVDLLGVLVATDCRRAVHAEDVEQQADSFDPIVR